MARVELDAARCVGHGRCYVLSPDVFGEDDRGHCVILVAEVEGERLEDARRGEDHCPEGAIRVVDTR